MACQAEITLPHLRKNCTNNLSQMHHSPILDKWNKKPILNYVVPSDKKMHCWNWNSLGIVTNEDIIDTSQKYSHGSFQLSILTRLSVTGSKLNHLYLTLNWHWAQFYTWATTGFIIPSPVSCINYPCVSQNSSPLLEYIRFFCLNMPILRLVTEL